MTEESLKDNLPTALYKHYCQHKKAADQAVTLARQGQLAKERIAKLKAELKAAAQKKATEEEKKRRVTDFTQKMQSIAQKLGAEWKELITQAFATSLLTKLSDKSPTSGNLCCLVHSLLHCAMPAVLCADEMKQALKEFAQRAQEWHAAELVKAQEAQEKAAQDKAQSQEKEIKRRAGDYVSVVGDVDMPAVAHKDAFTGAEVTLSTFLFLYPLPTDSHLLCRF